jgi:hypothetical protein
MKPAGSCMVGRGYNKWLSRSEIMIKAAKPLSVRS